MNKKIAQKFFAFLFCFISFFSCKEVEIERNNFLKLNPSQSLDLGLIKSNFFSEEQIDRQKNDLMELVKNLKLSLLFLDPYNYNNYLKKDLSNLDNIFKEIINKMNSYKIEVSDDDKDYVKNRKQINWALGNLEGWINSIEKCKNEIQELFINKKQDTIGLFISNIFNFTLCYLNGVDLTLENLQGLKPLFNKIKEFIESFKKDLSLDQILIILEDSVFSDFNSSGFLISINIKSFISKAKENLPQEGRDAYIKEFLRKYFYFSYEKCIADIDLIFSSISSSTNKLLTNNQLKNILNKYIINNENKISINSKAEENIIEILYRESSRSSDSEKISLADNILDFVFRISKEPYKYERKENYEKDYKKWKIKNDLLQSYIKTKSHTHIKPSTEGFFPMNLKEAYILKKIELKNENSSNKEKELEELKKWRDYTDILLEFIRENVKKREKLSTSERFHSLFPIILKQAFVLKKEEYEKSGNREELDKLEKWKKDTINLLKENQKKRKNEEKEEKSAKRVKI